MLTLTIALAPVQTLFRVFQDTAMDSTLELLLAVEQPLLTPVTVTTLLSLVQHQLLLQLLQKLVALQRLQLLMLRLMIAVQHILHIKKVFSAAKELQRQAVRIMIFHL